MRRLLAVSLVLSMFLAGCGDDDSADPGGDPSAPLDDEGSAGDDASDDPGDDATDDSADDSAGDGGGDDSNAALDALTAGLPEPCTIISDEQMSGLAGNPVAGEPLFTDCIYGPTEGNSGIDATEINLSVYNAPGDECGELLDIEVDFDPDAVTPVDGLGDRAQWVSSAGIGLGKLEVCDGEAYVGVTVNAPTDTPGDQLQSTARSVVDAVLAAI